MFKISFTREAWDDYIYWQLEDKKTLKKINQLIKDMSRNPFTGIGKVEQMKGDLSGYWSRRIDDKNRILYSVNDDTILIFQCKKHYRD